MGAGEQVLVDLLPAERRRTERFPSMIRGVLRNFRRGAEFIELLDISAEGCGFTSRWPFEVGARVSLGLPGLEPWPGIVVWYEEKQGGIHFDRPLHPAVAKRFATQIAEAGPSRAHLTPPEKD
jgi:hypothetical protein